MCWIIAEDVLSETIDLVWLVLSLQVFLKSDSLCLMEGERGRGQPTLPDVHTLAMHVQQQEIGAFTLTTGAYKWPKLRSVKKFFDSYSDVMPCHSLKTAERELQLQN